ncbi:cyclophane-forming radical SAM/SPASM peptide maturase GrrM/OscB [Mesorhizobium sp. RCC_202]|uniref:cyclophane-forming radical SAM/SPASM peptide maturase GrrM/OscB n=1 Tax=Mesorhizobium sp. RCC_202 TaxID=3239222 RepID=UPI0035242BEB
MAEFLNPASFRGVTQLLIMQPTAFCNIDCEYCYLPNRGDRTAMTVETARDAARFIFDAGLNAPGFTVVWHAGEPLVVRPRWYRLALAAMQEVAPQGLTLPHAIQTNGMLIDEEWCDFFLETGMRVGVSLDGPARLHDARRKTRSGQGTHGRVMRGIEQLQRRGVAFHIIAVVGRPTLAAADEFMDFFQSHGISNIGLNIEEIEGPIHTSTLQADGSQQGFRAFFARVIERASQAVPVIRLREREDLLACLESPGFGKFGYNSQNVPFGIVTVSVGGGLFTFSPELAGTRHDRFGDFSIGQLPGASVDRILASPTFQALWPEIEAGVKRCRESCPYFDVCLGGAPSNKLAENGSFDSTETMHCRLSHQAVADAVLADLEGRMPRLEQAPAAGAYGTAGP